MVERLGSASDQHHHSDSSGADEFREAGWRDAVYSPSLEFVGKL